MTDYRVRWEIDIEADTPEEAACKARVYAVNEDTTATVFDVYERDQDGVDGPVFQKIESFDVRGAPSHPHYRALTIEEADAEDEEESESTITQGNCAD